ncbi:MAG: 50S ribosomal protein L28 [Spirochaetales bacterium]|nr:50S ribosomal protein L28 [Spirochaetales bacterium]
MSRTCDFCGKGTTSGQNVPRKGLPRRKGGGGVKIGVRTKRTFKANLHSKSLLINGVKRKVKICSRCLSARDKQAV